MNDLQFTYYGDDFTGSTDALEVLTAAGMRSILFTKPPTLEMLSSYPGVQAVGLAGVSRSLPTSEMEAELRPAFRALSALNPRHLHYKVCSTFDSSPEVGSIGRAIEIGTEFSEASFVPLLVGNPVLGRYCIFGNLFGQIGIGYAGEVYRLDRHPTASSHPITPMCESDLRLHLGRQTDLKIALFDILKLALPIEQRREEFERLVGQGVKVVLLDSLYPDQLHALGDLLDGNVGGKGALFSVGSSGVEMALGAYWQATGKLAAKNDWEIPASVDQVLVVSGSCSPVTGAQITYALSHGFAEIALKTCVLKDEDCNSYLLQVTVELVNLIKSGKSVVVHTNRGDLDPDPARTAKLTAERNISSLEYQTSCSRRLGAALGQIITSAVEQTSLKRVCIAGGDSSSYASREVGVTALEMICPTVQGAPLCRASAPGRPVDGIEICFKGGQVGREDYFISLLRLNDKSNK
jgi:uncharacterized protein YgbK (DUF1537 family)